ncbi:MAG: hypothetical protein JXR46_13950 [Calditrichaceae bacterium]|nr:hypothetical protein [Calditrichaceae bacterium]MBN2710140.1 hypothetical protein [Calditrichaceae bacterium]RQV95792.1 MAG: hypothetical protein EH224_06355 [Calditrichota bacterium]
MYLKLIIPFLLLFIVTGCENPAEQDNSKLLISFRNKSAYQLNNLIVSDKGIGNLPVNFSSRYFGFDDFRFDSGLPDENASAVVNGKVYTNYRRGYWCGTEKITVTSGKYIINIEIVDTTLFLSCENSPTIDHP